MKSNIYYFLLLIAFITLTSCDSAKLKETPMSQFVGTWQLEGRNLFNGIQIAIQENEDGSYTGRVIKLNENKYVQLFLQEQDTWLASIERKSNFHFTIKEKRLAAPLFSLYGESTSTSFEAEFIDENQIGLAKNSDPQSSTIKYIRVK